MQEEAWSCLVCASDDTKIALDLGETALANKFLSADELAADNEVSYPLRLGFCRSCGHVQLVDHVQPAEMFSEYLYVSSKSTTLVDHLNELADDMLDRFDLSSESLVVDIGCNDGVLLERFLRRGVRTLGVDPAENIAKLSKRRGLEVLVDFFGARCANGILEKYGPAQALTMTNAFPHIPDVDDLLSGVRSLIAPEGVFAIQAHYVVDMFEQAAFDTIYHEHVSYWSLSVMKGLLSRFGLEPVRVKRLPIHHGQLRVYIQRVGVGTVETSVNELLELEAGLGIAEGRPLIEFADAAQRVRRDVRKFLEVARSEGKSVAAYGAPAKGSTLINYLGLDRRDLAWIADISELKQGRYMPGSHIPIVAPSQILTDMPDYLLLLAWNFADEIIEQNKRYTDSGGRFVLPLPTVKVL